jgi:dephospho-CoA kinase
MIRRRICISGLMGAGKTTCAGLILNALKDRCGKAVVIDADAEAKRLMQGNKAIQQRLAESFGESMISNGDIVFSALGRLAFSSMPKLLALNGIVHPPLLERLKELIFSKSNGCVICDAALIPLWQVEDWFDALMWVQSPFEQRRQRLLKKVPLTPEELTARMLLQQEIVPVPNQTPWIMIHNQGTLEELRPPVLSICAAITGQSNEGAAMPGSMGRPLSLKE